MKIKRLLTAAVLAGVCGFGLLATSSSANGPIMMPVAAPKVLPTMKVVPIQSKALALYREVRTFWLSRGIVR